MAPLSLPHLGYGAGSVRYHQTTAPRVPAWACCVLLDVDDLGDISELEAYVEQTAVILFFVSKGYFKSKNCLREIRHTIALRKPVVLVHDPVRGGATLELIRKEECPLELHDGTFLRPGSGEERDVITWHRIKVPACP